MASVGLRLGDGWRRAAPREWLEHWHPHTVSVRGGTLDVVEVGEGPAVLLIPPLPGYKEAFVACAWRLAHSFRVITYDLRAHLEGVEDPWDLLLEDVDRLLDALGVRDLHVVGHSLGGAVAQHWALQHPDRVRRLVLSSAFARVTTPRGHRWARYVEQPCVLAAQRWTTRDASRALAARLARREAWVYDRHCDRAVLEIATAAIRACPIRVALDRVRLAYSHDTRRRLADIRCPTLLIVGDRDTAFAHSAVTELAQLIPHAIVRESPEAGHLHPLSNAAWFAHTLESWLKEPAPG